MVRDAQSRFESNFPGHLAQGPSAEIREHGPGAVVGLCRVGSEFQVGDDLLHGSLDEWRLIGQGFDFGMAAWTTRNPMLLSAEANTGATEARFAERS